MEKEKNKNERERALVVTSWISVVGNAILSGAKIAVGVIAGSMAVLGDGVDSAADVVVSVVMLVAAYIISRPPSRRYPFGLDKAESVATLVLSLVIFYAGVQMLVTSVGAMISGEERALPGVLALWVTLFSIAGKLALSWYQFRVGRRVDSDLLVANAKNMRNDVLISAGVLVGLFFTYVLRLPILDSVTGCVIALFIIKTAVEIFRESCVELVDGVRDETIYKKVFDAVDRVPCVSNPHHLRLRRIGGKYMIDIDIEIDGDTTLTEAHEIADKVEKSVCCSVENVYDIEIHVEPLGTIHTSEPFGVAPEMIEEDS